MSNIKSSAGDIKFGVKGDLALNNAEVWNSTQLISHGQDTNVNLNNLTIMTGSIVLENNSNLTANNVAAKRNIILNSPDKGVDVNLNNLTANTGDIKLEHVSNLTVNNAKSSGFFSVVSSNKGVDIIMNNIKSGDMIFNLADNVTVNNAEAKSHIIVSSIVQTADININSNEMVFNPIANLTINNAVAKNGFQIIFSSERTDINLNNIKSSTGDIELNTQGKITSNNAEIGGMMKIFSDELQLTGNHSVGGNITLNSLGNIGMNKALLTTPADIVMDANGLMIDNDSTLTSNRLNIRAEALNNQGKIMTKELAGSGNDWRNQGSVRVDSEQFSLDVTNLQNDGKISAAGKTLVQNEWRDGQPTLQWK